MGRVVVVVMVDRLVGDLDFLVVAPRRVGRVDGGSGDADLLAVAGLDSGAVLALGNVNGRVVGAVLGIDLDASVGVVRVRPASRTCQSVVPPNAPSLLRPGEGDWGRRGLPLISD